MSAPDTQRAASCFPFGRFSLLARSLLVLGTVIAIVLTGLEHLRKTARDVRCRHHLERVAVALEFYYSYTGHFPPPYLSDKSGRPMHSWRVLAMMFLVNGKPYDFGIGDYQFSEPWNSPANASFLAGPARHFRDYSCPDDSAQSRFASYVCVVGGTLWPARTQIVQSWNVSGWPHSTGGGVLPSQGKAILLIELVRSDIPWTKPTDIALSELVSLLRDDPSGEQFRCHIRHVVAVDTAGIPSILDSARDYEEIKELVEAEAAGKAGQR